MIFVQHFGGLAPVLTRIFIYLNRIDDPDIGQKCRPPGKRFHFEVYFILNVGS